jgi:hypothetical protein
MTYIQRPIVGIISNYNCKYTFGSSAVGAIWGSVVFFHIEDGTSLVHLKMRIDIKIYCVVLMKIIKVK